MAANTPSGICPAESHRLVKMKLHNFGVFLSPCTKQTPWSCILKNNSVIGVVSSLWDLVK